MRQEELTGIGYFAKSIALHLEDAYFGGGTETVFQCTEDAVAIVAITFELKHCIDNVFQHLGTGQTTVLGDVSDK